MLYQLSYEATHWERGQFIEFISSRAVKWWSLFTFIYNRSSNMNYFISTSQKDLKFGVFLSRKFLSAVKKLRVVKQNTLIESYATGYVVFHTRPKHHPLITSFTFLARSSCFHFFMKISSSCPHFSLLRWSGDEDVKKLATGILFTLRRKNLKTIRGSFGFVFDLSSSRSERKVWPEIFIFSSSGVV